MSRELTYPYILYVLHIPQKRYVIFKGCKVSDPSTCSDIFNAQASAAESLLLGSTTNKRWTKSCAHICQRCWEIWEIWELGMLLLGDAFLFHAFRVLFSPDISPENDSYTCIYIYIMIYSNCILFHHLDLANTELLQPNDPIALQFSEALPQMAWQFDVFHQWAYPYYA